MPIRAALRKILLCLVLGFGSIVGVAMRPEEIEELMNAMSRPRVEATIAGQESGEP